MELRVVQRICKEKLKESSLIKHFKIFPKSLNE